MTNNESLGELIQKCLSTPLAPIGDARMEQAEIELQQAYARGDSFKEAEPHYRKALHWNPYLPKVLMHLLGFADGSSAEKYETATKILALASNALPLEDLEQEDANIPASLSRGLAGDVFSLSCSFIYFAEDAGRYSEANKLRRSLLKGDARDGVGLRFFDCAHSMMIGDVRRVGRWLRWAARHQQVDSYWCWVRVWLNILTDDKQLKKSFTQAYKQEPDVGRLLVGYAPPARHESYCVRSFEEASTHAAILWRAFHAHPQVLAQLHYLMHMTGPAPREA